MTQEKTSYAIIAIVAIVAIVGLIALLTKPSMLNMQPTQNNQLQQYKTEKTAMAGGAIHAFHTPIKVVLAHDPLIFIFSPEDEEDNTFNLVFYAIPQQGELQSLGYKLNNDEQHSIPIDECTYDGTGYACGVTNLEASPGDNVITVTGTTTAGGNSVSKTFYVNPQCGDIITKDLTLRHDLTNCQQHGLTILADDVVLDCNGHWIGGNVGGAYGLYILNNHHNIVVENCNVWGFNEGVRLENSYNVMIKSSSFYENSECGVAIISSNDNYLINNTVNDNSYCGINIISSNDNYLTHNIAKYNYYHGIILHEGSSNNFLVNNGVFGNNMSGIHLDSADSNIFNSNVMFSNGKGVAIAHSHDNLFVNNVFNNSLNYEFSEDVGINFWNNNQYGNKWLKPDGSGYSQTCADNNNDGFCDEPYVLNENNTDYKPIVAP